MVGGSGRRLLRRGLLTAFGQRGGVAGNALGGDAVGEPVLATHPDDLEIAYSLSGTDAASFAVDEVTGQIRVREGVELVVGNTYYGQPDGH